METIAQQRLEKLKDQGSTDLQDYIDTFDADLKAKDVRLREAEQEIGRLTAEMRRLSTGIQSSGGGLLKRGREQDLYEHEIEDIVIDALAELRRTVMAGSRRDNVANDLLAANQHSGSRQRLEEEVKALLRGYRDMDARLRNSLVRLGFEISEEGKHFKAVFQGDGRYTFSIPKSSSDTRAGLNLASDINKQLF
jgi:chromosome segregation ATPase